MRLVLHLDHPPRQVLPINYPWLIASWIYRTLEKANPEFSHWLHHQGFGHQGKQYKLFTFSPLRPQRYQIDTQQHTFQLTESPTRLTLSFYMDEAVQHFVIGLFQDQDFTLKSGSFSAPFRVHHIETLPPPQWRSSLRFRLQTPLCLSRQAEGAPYATYLHPHDEGYAEQLLQNLLRKQAAAQPQLAPRPSSPDHINFPYHFRLLSTPRSKLLSIKGTKVRGKGRLG